MNGVSAQSEVVFPFVLSSSKHGVAWWNRLKRIYQQLLKKRDDIPQARLFHLL